MPNKPFLRLKSRLLITSMNRRLQPEPVPRVSAGILNGPTIIIWTERIRLDTLTGHEWTE